MQTIALYYLWTIDKITARQYWVLWWYWLVPTKVGGSYEEKWTMAMFLVKC